MAELNGNPVGSESLQALALINYGHFTSMRIESGTVRGLDLHLNRLARDCDSFFDTNLDRNWVRQLIHQAIAIKQGELIDLRVTVFDPELPLGRPGIDATPHILITFRDAMPSESLPALRVQPVRYSRESPQVKHVGLCGTIRLRRKAQRSGFDDVLFIESDGSLSEGATWNIGFFDGQEVIWPKANMLDGTTMQLLKQVHRNVSVRPVGLAELSNFQTAFATNASIGIRPIKTIGNIEFDDTHSIFAILRKKYLAITPDVI